MASMNVNDKHKMAPICQRCGNRVFAPLPDIRFDPVLLCEGCKAAPNAE